MSRRKFAVSILLVALMVAVGPALAGDMGTPGNVKGTIAAVDANAKTLTVQWAAEAGKPAGEVRLAADDQTKVTRDGQAVGLADLKQGDHVVVEFRTDGNKKVAVSISVHPAAAPKG